MKQFILVVFLFSIKYADAQTIKGQVRSATNGKPVAGASVYLYTDKKFLITDTLGVFNVRASEKNKMTVTAEGFETFDTLIFCKNQGDIWINIRMKEKEEVLEEVVIVASPRTNSRIEDLPTKVEVLGSEEVHEENGIKPGNIASLLGDIAGIQIQQTNPATGSAEMRIQGLQGKYTQILRDGMPLFGGYSGSFGILQVPPLDLQQIELVKGAASTLYGGGAIAGMLNLVSKKPKLGKPEASVTLNRSTLNENNVNLFFSGRNQKQGYTVYAGGTYQQPVDVNKDGFSDVPSVKTVCLHPRFFMYGTKGTTVTIGYTLNYEDRNGGDMNVLTKAPGSDGKFFIQNKSWRNTIDVMWDKKISETAQFTAKFNTGFYRRDIFTNSFNLGGDQQNWYSELAYSQKINRHQYVAGLNFTGDKFKINTPANSILPKENNATLGVFMQDDWKLNNQFTVQAGLRLDKHNQYGAFFLPRLSFMYKPTQQLTFRAGGGMGYKTPTLFNAEIDERNYRYIHGYVSGITPENSHGANFDVNYKTHFNGWQMTLNQTFFYTRINNPILLNAMPTIWNMPVYMYDNEKQPVETEGLETYIQLSKEQLELYLGYVYTNAKRNYNPYYPNMPLIASNKFASVIAYEFSSKFRAGIEASYTGKQYLDNGKTTKPYFFTAMMLRYNLGKASVVLNGENLFDFRQNKTEPVVFPPFNNPVFPEIWAPLDGRVINLSVFYKIR